ncbi:hypothetical protein AABB24_004319 [Solanum stoloniferum]|uniref:Replication factor A C-terminal domain-containing protein n=1 Tax=Solanum stoloniferum TaxID=62892 RepID=A0ABD2VBB4_9SOLN
MRLYLWLTSKHNLRDKYLMLRLNCPLQVRINALVCWHAQIVSNCSRDITSEGKSTAQVVTNPHILFLVTIKDNSGFATTIVSDEIAKKMLHLTSEEIYEICFIKKETLSLQNVEDQLNGKIFNIQMKRLFTKRMDATQKLFILSYLEKQDVIHKPMTSTTVNVTDAKKRTIEHLSSGEKEYPSMQMKNPPIKKN